jgi:GINS complex subunit 1
MFTHETLDILFYVVFLFLLKQDVSPPKELMVEIRVLQSCGEILTESGPVNLERNTTHYLRRSDIEPFIRKGLVEQVV